MIFPLKKSSFFGVLIASCTLFCSCGFNTAVLESKPIQSLKKNSMQSVKNLMPTRIPIATVRANELKPLPTGAERLAAWKKSQASKQRYASISKEQQSNISKLYKAPILPTEQSTPTDGGILPPLAPGIDSSLEAQGLLPSE